MNKGNRTTDEKNKTDFDPDHILEYQLLGLDDFLDAEKGGYEV